MWLLFLFSVRCGAMTQICSQIFFWLIVHPGPLLTLFSPFSSLFRIPQSRINPEKLTKTNVLEWRNPYRLRLTASGERRPRSPSAGCTPRQSPYNPNYNLWPFPVYVTSCHIREHTFFLCECWGWWVDRGMSQRRGCSGLARVWAINSKKVANKFGKSRVAAPQLGENNKIMI